jgi:phosphinothricin acetyltransferase
MTAQIRVRPATPDDAAAIAEIYNQGIRARIATFETEERTPEERRAWIADHTNHTDRYPIVVATIEGGEVERVIGWAAASPYSSRACYAGVAEFSIYIHEDERGKGVGSVLIEAFIAASERAGLWKLTSRIFPENMASRNLCKKSGFAEIGVHKKHAQLDGVWKDNVIVERLIPTNQA